MKLFFAKIMCEIGLRYRHMYFCTFLIGTSFGRNFSNSLSKSFEKVLTDMNFLSNALVKIVAKVVH